MNIVILGSCVSRDCFSYLDDSEINLEKYFARSSIISLASESINKSINAIDLDSNFQKRMVYYDVNKLFYSELEKSNANILLLDFIDERLDVLHIEENKYITYSSEFNRTNNFKKMIKGKRISEEDRVELWKDCFDIFIEKTSKLINLEDIYINKVYYCNKYLDKDKNILSFEDQELIKNKNKLLDGYYKYIKDKYPLINFIDLEKEYLSDEMHKWGLSPFHYEDKYYLDVVNELTNIKNKYI